MIQCDFCSRTCDPTIGPAKQGWGDQEGKLWCGRCKEGRALWYEALLPLTESFLRAAIICDSHDIKQGNFKDGFEREKFLDRLYDFGEMLKERGIKDFKDDCDCPDCSV